MQDNIINILLQTRGKVNGSKNQEWSGQKDFVSCKAISPVAVKLKDWWIELNSNNLYGNFFTFVYERKCRVWN